MQLGTAPTDALAGGPDLLLRALRTAGAELASAPRPSGTQGSRAEWAAVVTECQQVMNRAAAMQDEAIVALSAIEPVDLDDGTEGETHRAPGHVALDAPAIVSGALTVSAVHAERRVRAAVRLAADGPSGTHTETGLEGLHGAMRRGDLDAYRASVVMDELELAPPEVAAAVVDTLGTQLLTDTAPRLRRRCRTLLSLVSPDLVRERAVRARETCALRRWAEEPGVDKWEGTFPSEDAARAWAAIDARAHQLVDDGTCPRIERARAQALVDLVTGSATIETIVTLTVPAPALPKSKDIAIGNDSDPAVDDSSPRAASPRHGPGTNGSLTPRPRGGGPPGASPPRDGSPADHPSGDGSPAADPTRDGSPADHPSNDGSPDDLVEVSVGPRGERVLVSRQFLDAATTNPGATVAHRSCDPLSGALLDHRSSGAYRPPASLAAMVRQRDGRCRFPGCHVSARFCDLDHVRPWPAGPTAARNLVCLCRRHHRVKQRPGWRLLLHPDATVTWVDPTGRERRTQPVDALTALVLPAPEGAARLTAPVGAARATRGSASASASATATATATATAMSRTGTPVGSRVGPASSGFSRAEYSLEHALAVLTHDDDLCRAALRRFPGRGPGGRLRLDFHHGTLRQAGRPGLVVAIDLGRPPEHRRGARARPSDPDDDPPF